MLNSCEFSYVGVQLRNIKTRQRGMQRHSPARTCRWSEIAPIQNSPTKSLAAFVESGLSVLYEILRFK
jgi:hypothetical protein